MGKQYEEICRSPVIDDSLNTATLGMADLIRLLASKLNSSDEAELQRQEVLSQTELKMYGSLTKFFDRATERMLAKKETSVTLKLSSRYLPYLPKVIGSNGKGLSQYYAFEMQRDSDIPISRDHFFILRVWLRGHEPVTYKEINWEGIGLKNEVA